ncbi:MAG TPA: ShlB/FhaC/HecB family hemolysin secretion/activation protein [Ramlibacter sp.]|nr:ShlB/FhaC/HecB family hemolysin secretion/activation protein [Ramlibacter sp.]
MKKQFTPLALAACLACGFASPGAFAQNAPAAPVAPAAPTIDVTRYVLDGKLPLSDAQVQATLAPYIGPRKSLSDIEGAAQALETELRNKGYAFHRLYVPAQRPANGEIRLQVVEFTLGAVEVTGNESFSSDNIRRSLPTLKEGVSPEVKTLGADVSASNTNPAKQITVTFRESRQPNAVDAVVRVKDAPPSSFIASFTANQHVSGDAPQANVARVTGAYQHSNLFDRDHVMTLSYTTDPRHPSSVSLYGLYYQIPLYGTGMNAAVYYTESDINSGRVQQGAGFFDVSGSGRFSGVRLSKALPRSASLQPTVSVAFDERVFKNTTTFNGAIVQPDVGSRVLSAQFALRDEATWGLWNAFIEHAANVGGGSSNDDASHAANGGERHWRLWRYGGEVTVPVAKWQVTSRLKGQETGSALVSGEQFGLGGATSVRGFADRVVAGETGYQWSVEGLGPALYVAELRPVLFLEGGSVKAKATGARETIAAAGAGLRWTRPGYQIAADLAQAVNEVSTVSGSKGLRLTVGVQAKFEWPPARTRRGLGWGLG